MMRALTFKQLGFVIPFGARPEQCYDEITPNDMYTSLTCAFSGAFIIAGGLSIAVWSELDATFKTNVALTVNQSLSALCRCISKFAGTLCREKDFFTGRKALAGLSRRAFSLRPSR